MPDSEIPIMSKFVTRFVALQCNYILQFYILGSVGSCSGYGRTYYLVSFLAMVFRGFLGEAMRV